VDKIISYLFIHTTKSFKDFLGSFYNSKSFSNNILETEKYIIFDSIKPSINTSLIKQYSTFQTFYKQSKKEKKLNNIISLFFYKYKTITKITIKKEDETIEIVNVYKEFSRVISYPTDNDFTHLLTITYRHKNYNAISEKPEYNKIFKIMKDNEIIREKNNKGIHRMRNYIRKRLKDNLKKKIKDKELLNKEVNKLLNTIFKYYKIYETHKTGHLHTHMLIKLPRFITNLKFKEIIKKMAAWFDTEIQGIDLKRLKGSKDKAKQYVLKYMYKQFNNDNLFYVENEKKEKIYLLRIDALIRNDIPRMTSKSRNVKTEKFKPNFKIKKEKSKEKQKETREIIRLERELTKRHYKEFKDYLKDFKTIKEKKLEFEIKQAEKRTEILEKLQLFTDKELKQLLNDKYFSIKDISRCLDYCRIDKIIRERFNTLYLNALHKFNKLLDALEKEIIDF
jgi:hypothetical protein